MSSSSKHDSSQTDSTASTSTNSTTTTTTNSKGYSKTNNEEEELKKSNEEFEHSDDENPLQQIDSMPSLDSEFLMSSNLNNYNINTNDNDSPAITTLENIESDNGPTNFPSIMPDELPSLDSSLINSNKKGNEDLFSSGSYSAPESPILPQNLIQNSPPEPIDNDNDTKKNSKVQKVNILAKKSSNPLLSRPRTKISNTRPNFKTKSDKVSREVYACDFDNTDDDVDPSSTLPMPMQMRTAQRRRTMVPLKKSIFSENDDTHSKSGKPKFEGFAHMEEVEPTLVKTCHRCSKPIEKDGAFVNGFYFHRLCLICSKCGKEIKEKKKCYMYHEGLICDQCVRVKKGDIKLCHICGQKIYGPDEREKLSDGQYVHSKCVNCYMCGKHLSLSDAILVNESKVEKGGDEDEASESSSNSRKKKRKQKKKGPADRRTSNFNCDTLIVESDGVKTLKFVCKRCNSFLLKNQICCVCKNPVLENVVVKNQRVFHRQCFRCEHKNCQKCLFGNSYVVHHNKFLCWEHGKIYSISCAYCKQLFKSYETDRIKWNGKLYHKCCFVCRVCGCTLDPQLCKSVHGRPHCDNCFQIRISEGDCDEKGRSLYIHYDQVDLSNRNLTSPDEEEEEEEDESLVEAINGINSKENIQKKHNSHLHIAQKASQRKSRFQEKYNVSISWPEYGEKTFEKAQPFSPEEDKNVFKKF